MLLSSLLIPILAAGVTAQVANTTATNSTTAANSTTGYPDGARYPGTGANFPDVKFVTPNQTESWVVGKRWNIEWTWPDANLTENGTLPLMVLNLLHKNITKGPGNEDGRRLTLRLDIPIDGAHKVEVKGSPAGVTNWRYSTSILPNAAMVGDGYWLQLWKLDAETHRVVLVYATSDQFALQPREIKSGAIPTAAPPVAVATIAMGVATMLGAVLV